MGGETTMKRNLLPLDLQLFAENEEGTAEENVNENETKQDEKDGENKEPEKKYTDDDVNAIIDKKFAKWKADQEEAKKLEQMNDDEKKDHQLTQLEKELADLKADKARTEMSKVASKMMEDENIKASDAILNLLVRETADETKPLVNDFIKLMNDQREAIRSEITASIKQKTLSFGNGDSGAELDYGASLAKRQAPKQAETNYFQ